MKKIIFLIGIIFTIFLISAVESAASSLFSDGFETYNIGNIDDQGSWACPDTLYSLVVSGTSSEGNQSLKRSKEDNSWLAKEGNVEDTGTISFDIYLQISSTSSEDGYYYFSISEDISIDSKDLYLLLENPTTTDYANAYKDGELLGTIQKDTWTNITISWAKPLKKAWYLIEGNEQVIIEDAINSTSTLNWFLLYKTNPAESEKLGIDLFYLDNIITTGDDDFCSEDNCSLCLTELGCTSAGCSWGYIYVTNPPTAICYKNYSDYNYITEFDCHLWYATNSKYSTETDIYKWLASSTCPFLLNILGFVNDLDYKFSGTSALSYASSYGSVIPQARGYLLFIDDIIGYPISYFIVIYIGLILTIALIRFIKGWI